MSNRICKNTTDIIYEAAYRAYRAIFEDTEIQSTEHPIVSEARKFAIDLTDGDADTADLLLKRTLWLISTYVCKPNKRNANLDLSKTYRFLLPIVQNFFLGDSPNSFNKTGAAKFCMKLGMVLPHLYIGNDGYLIMPDKKTPVTYDIIQDNADNIAFSAHKDVINRYQNNDMDFSCTRIDSYNDLANLNLSQYVKWNILRPEVGKQFFDDQCHSYSTGNSTRTILTCYIISLNGFESITDKSSELYPISLMYILISPDGCMVYGVNRNNERISEDYVEAIIGSRLADDCEPNIGLTLENVTELLPPLMRMSKSENPDLYYMLREIPGIEVSPILIDEHFPHTLFFVSRNGYSRNSSAPENVLIINELRNSCKFLLPWDNTPAYGIKVLPSGVMCANTADGGILFDIDGNTLQTRDGEWYNPLVNGYGHGEYSSQCIGVVNNPPSYREHNIHLSNIVLCSNNGTVHPVDMFTNLGDSSIKSVYIHARNISSNIPIVVTLSNGIPIHKFPGTENDIYPLDISRIANIRIPDGYTYDEGHELDIFNQRVFYISTKTGMQAFSSSRPVARPFNFYGFNIMNLDSKLLFDTPIYGDLESDLDFDDDPSRPYLTYTPVVNTGRTHRGLPVLGEAEPQTLEIDLNEQTYIISDAHDRIIDQGAIQWHQPQGRQDDQTTRDTAD